MASTSLGTLTLDLAVKLSEFTDGLSQAEREARDSTGRISGSVRGMRDNIAEDIGKISGSLIGMTVGAVAVAGAAMAAMAIETAKADVQLGIMAGTANTSLKSFQVLSHAAAGFGVEQEALGAIIADTQEKLGEFSATGGGGAADFMEALQNNTKMTDDQIRELGKTLQSKDGVGAIQYLKDELDALGATSQEQRFIMESLAGDLGNLMPLFANGGLILEEYGTQLEAAGVIKTQEAIDQSRRLAAQTQAIQTQFEGLKTQLVASTIPAMSTLIDYFSEGSKKSRGFRNEVDGVGDAVRITTGLIIGMAASVAVVAKSFQTVGAQMRAIGLTFTNFVEADGVVAKSKALIGGTITSAGLMAVGMRSVSDEYDRAIKAFESSSVGQQKRLTGLASVYYDANTFMQSNTSGLALNTVEANTNAKAIEARTKALEKAQKTAGTAKLEPNAKALSNAENYGFANYEAQYGLPQGLMTGIHMQESHGNTNATGPSTKWGTAKGGFQLIDATAKRFQVDNAYNMKQATEGAAKYLSYLYKHFNGDLAKTIAAYNTGEGNVDNNPMSLILSDRWARNKKTGIGQTKEYTKNVLAYMKSATTDTSKLVYDTVTKQAQDAQNLQEETLRKQSSIATKWATEREKIETDYLNNKAEVEKNYVAGSVNYIKYMARVEEDYAKAKNSGLLSISEKYFSEEQKIHDNHKKALLAIDNAYIEDGDIRQKYIDRQNEMYKEDLANFRYTQEQKSSAQGLAASKLSDVINLSANQALSAVEDLRAKQSMRPDLYQKWKLEKDHKINKDIVDQMYGSRKGEIEAKNINTGDPVFDATQRNELLQEAKQEHLNKMLLLEEEHSVNKKELDKQLMDSRIAMQEMTFRGMTSAAAMFFGENSRMHRIAFAMERGFAVQKALMNVKETYSNTFNAISAIPLVGPYMALPMAAAASAIQVAQAAGIGSMATPTVSGIAHGGLDYVPKESTYLLDKGERVLSPNQNSDLTKFMNNGSTNSNVQVNIINNSSARIQSSDNGRTITITDVRNEVKRGFAELSNPNSHSSKMVERSTRAGRRR